MSACIKMPLVNSRGAFTGVIARKFSISIPYLERLTELKIICEINLTLKVNLSKFLVEWYEFCIFFL